MKTKHLPIIQQTLLSALTVWAFCLGPPNQAVAAEDDRPVDRISAEQKNYDDLFDRIECGDESALPKLLANPEEAFEHFQIRFSSSLGDPKPLLEQLGAPDYPTRENATKRLLAMPPEIAPVVKNHLKSHKNDPEIVWRCSIVLKALRGKNKIFPCNNILYARFLIGCDNVPDSLTARFAPAYRKILLSRPASLPECPRPYPFYKKLVSRMLRTNANTKKILLESLSIPKGHLPPKALFMAVADSAIKSKDITPLTAIISSFRVRLQSNRAIRFLVYKYKKQLTPSMTKKLVDSLVTMKYPCLDAVLEELPRCLFSPTPGEYDDIWLGILQAAESKHGRKTNRGLTT